jgi:flagellar hook protein FlgE
MTAEESLQAAIAIAKGGLGLPGNQPDGDLKELSSMRALSIAATGMSAQETNVEVIANNIANINTTAFARPRRVRRPSLPGRTGRGRPTAAARTRCRKAPASASASARWRPQLHIQAVANTTNPLDLAISGRGWFQIVGPAAKRSIPVPARSTRARPASW